MPRVNEPVAITALYGQPRDGMHRHVFVGANFFMLQMLNEHRDELAVKARSPKSSTQPPKRTAEFLRPRRRA